MLKGDKAMTDDPVKAIGDLAVALKQASDSLAHLHPDRREPVRARAERVTPVEIETGHG